jgi:hypothetical protein
MRAPFEIEERQNRDFTFSGISRNWRFAAPAPARNHARNGPGYKIIPVAGVQIAALQYSCLLRKSGDFIEKSTHACRVFIALQYVVPRLHPRENTH